MVTRVLFPRVSWAKLREVMLIHSSTPGPGQRPHQWALRASGWQNMSPQHMTVGFQDTPSLEMQLRHIDHFDLRALWKTTNAGQGFLWILLICLKTDPLKHPKCHKSPPWESHQLHQVRLLSQGRRLEVNTIPHKVGHQLSYLSFILLRKGPFIFLKNLFLFPTITYIPLPLSLLRWYLILNSKHPWGLTHFRLVISHVSRRYIH